MRRLPTCHSPTLEPRSMSANNGQSVGPAGLPEEQRNALVSKSQYQAHILAETFGAGVLATVSSGSRPGSEVGPGGYKVYHDKILAASGPAKDPIDQMMTEQLLWAHHRIGNLHVAAATAKEAELA